MLFVARAAQHDLAIPFFQRAIELNTLSEYAYLWLAASLWATTADRSQVLPLLRRATYRHRGDWPLRQIPPELVGMMSDSEFAEVFKAVI